jgi:hypothetical protein
MRRPPCAILRPWAAKGIASLATAARSSQETVSGQEPRVIRNWQLRAYPGSSRSSGAKATANPFSLTLISLQAAQVRQCRGELAAAQQIIQQLVTLTREYGFSLYDLMGSVTLGCLAVQDGKVEEETITLISNGLAQLRAKRFNVYVPFFLSFLAQGYAQRGRLQDALATIAEAIQSPYGTYPGYVSLIEKDFDRAGESAWLLGLSCDCKDLGLPGLSFATNYAHGYGARDAGTGKALPDEEEFDLTVDYRVQQGPLRGLWFRLRNAYVDFDHKGGSSNDLRLSVNYELPVL